MTESEIETDVVEETFPPKPEAIKRTDDNIRSVVSLILFFFAFYYIFHGDVKLVCLLTLVILIHELGHLTAMKIFNYADVKIFFVPFLGGVAIGKKENISQRQKTIILLAGPVPGIIIGSILFLLWKNQEGNLVLWQSSHIFLLLNLFNLLPVYPLDGGQLVNTLFMKASSIISTVFILLSIGALFYVAAKTEDYYFIMFPVFLASNVFMQKQITDLRKIISADGINLNKPYEELTDKEYWTIRDYMAERVARFKRWIKKGERTISVRENAVMNYVKSLLIKTITYDMGVLDKIMTLIIIAVCFYAPFLVGMRIPYLQQ